MYLFSLLVFI